MTTRRRFLLPVVGRHVVMEFLRTAALTFAAFVAIYVVADFFDRFDTFLKHDVGAATIAKSFLFKLPLVVTQVMPMAVLAGALIGLGLLARQNEFVALRSCGVSIWQVAAPLLALAAAISGAVFAWNETVLPDMARRWHEVENREVRRKGLSTIFTGREVWYHGRAGFYNIGRILPRRGTIAGLTVYQLGPDFRPRRIIEAASASWDGDRWNLQGTTTRDLGPHGATERDGTPEKFTLPETPEDFQVAWVEPEEFSYAMLRRHIKSLRSKGVDASESWVDLHLKIALPAATFIMMLLAVPLAARGTRTSSLPAAAALGFVIGFAYFIVLSFSRALGQSQAVPPLIAAWAPNTLFLLVGGYFLLGAD